MPDNIDGSDDTADDAAGASNESNVPSNKPNKDTQNDGRKPIPRPELSLPPYGFAPIADVRLPTPTPEHIDILPPHWFGSTLKHLYLLFSHPHPPPELGMPALDSFVINSRGHLLPRFRVGPDSDDEAGTFAIGAEGAAGAHAEGEESMDSVDGTGWVRTRPSCRPWRAGRG